jgi:hypothetical protein
MSLHYINMCLFYSVFVLIPILKEESPLLDLICFFSTAPCHDYLFGSYNLIVRACETLVINYRGIMKGHNLITGLHEGCLCLSLLLVCFRFHNALIALCFILYEKMFWNRATILGFMHGKCQS